MTAFALVASALVVRVLSPVDGAVDCPPDAGQSVLAAYSAEFEPIWHHAVPSTVVDRVSAARQGRVEGLGASDRLVLALLDERATFDATRPLDGTPTVFPHSPELVRAYGKLSGRDYVNDMMVVVAPKLGSQSARSMAVVDLYETLFALEGRAREPSRTFGTDRKGAVLLVFSRPRTWCWLERCFGDDGSAYAQKLAEQGYRVTRVDANGLTDFSVADDGMVVGPDGCRYGTMVLRNVSVRDGDRYRRAFGVRQLKTKVYAKGAPIVFGAEVVWSDPLIPQERSHESK